MPQLYPIIIYIYLYNIYSMWNYNDPTAAILGSLVLVLEIGWNLMGLVGNGFLVWGRRLIRRPVRVCRFFDIWYLLISWVSTLVMQSWYDCLLGWGGLITFMYTCVLATATLWCVDVHLRTHGVLRCDTFMYTCVLILNTARLHVASLEEVASSKFATKSEFVSNYIPCSTHAHTPMCGGTMPSVRTTWLWGAWTKSCGADVEKEFSEVAAHII